jgi:hypothetical protein
MSKDREARHDSPSPPHLIYVVFAAVLMAAGMFNLWRNGSPGLTIFLCTASLLTLGVNVGKLIGRP